MREEEAEVVGIQPVMGVEPAVLAAAGPLEEPADRPYHKVELQILVVEEGRPMVVQVVLRLEMAVRAS